MMKIQFDQIFTAMQVDTHDGELRMSAQDERDALRALKQALQSGIDLLRTWNGYEEVTDRLNIRLQITLRMRRLGSTHAWVAGDKPYFHQGSDLPVNCAIALNAILEESRSPTPCIPDYERAEAVANTLAKAIAPVGFAEDHRGWWVEKKRYMGLHGE
jgi:hypothetical protein